MCYGEGGKVGPVAAAVEGITKWSCVLQEWQEQVDCKHLYLWEKEDLACRAVCCHASSGNKYL